MSLGVEPLQMLLRIFFATFVLGSLWTASAACTGCDYELKSHNQDWGNHWGMGGMHGMSSSHNWGVPSSKNSNIWGRFMPSSQRCKEDSCKKYKCMAVHGMISKSKYCTTEQNSGGCPHGFQECGWLYSTACFVISLSLSLSRIHVCQLF